MGGPNLTLSLRRKLDPSQFAGALMATIIECHVSGTTLQMVPNIGITTGTTTVEIGLIRGDPFNDFYEITGGVTDAFNVTVDDPAVPDAFAAFIIDGGDWKTDTNGPISGTPCLIT